MFLLNTILLIVVVHPHFSWPYQSYHLCQLSQSPCLLLLKIPMELLQSLWLIPRFFGMFSGLKPDVTQVFQFLILQAPRDLLGSPWSPPSVATTGGRRPRGAARPRRGGGCPGDPPAAAAPGSIGAMRGRRIDL